MGWRTNLINSTKSGEKEQYNLNEMSGHDEWTLKCVNPRPKYTPTHEIPIPLFNKRQPTSQPATHGQQCAIPFLHMPPHSMLVREFITLPWLTIQFWTMLSVYSPVDDHKQQNVQSAWSSAQRRAVYSDQPGHPQYTFLGIIDFEVLLGIPELQVDSIRFNRLYSSATKREVQTASQTLRDRW